MYKQCRTEQSANRQRALEQGLLEAMTQQHYDEISVSELCTRMEIPRKSFYRYFSSKEGALHALIDHSLTDYEGYGVPELTQSSRTGQQDMERFFAYWKHQKPLLDALEKSSLGGILIQRAVSHAISEVTLPGRFLPGDEKSVQEHVTAFAVCGLMSMVIQWHHEGYQDSVQYMARISVRLVSQPLFPNLESFF